VATDLSVHREVAGGRAHYVAADVHAFTRAIDAALQTRSIPCATAPYNAPDAARVAQDWLHFWSQTR